MFRCDIAVAMAVKLFVCDTKPGVCAIIYDAYFTLVPCTSAVLDPRIGRFVNNLPLLSSVFK